MAARRRRTRSTTSAPGVRVRMYRHGLGDCHLVSIPKEGGGDFHLMIDCGVILGTPAPEVQKLKDAVKDIATITNGKVDVLAVTHEHWDHVSGFLQAADELKKPKLEFGQVWFAWTEDPRDALAAKLKSDFGLTLKGLRAAAQTLGLGPDDGFNSLLGFFGAAGGGTTSDALEAARRLSTTPPRYCRPDDAPWDVPGASGVRIFALGPPRDEKQLRKLLSTSETYGIDEGAFHAAARASLQGDLADEQRPFEPTVGFDLAALRGAGNGSSLGTFFQEHYFGLSGAEDQGWRRIDADWLGAANDFALQLDSYTNNTSLVLAIELSPGGKVLLFAADAQVGNWLSWQDAAWTLPDGRRVSGPELLERTVLYKVGHHGSHNATLRAKGLELMTSDELVALVPVDEKMAGSKGWKRMPLPGLMKALEEKTGGRVARTDDKADRPAWAGLKVDPAWFEVTVAK